LLLWLYHRALEWVYSGSKLTWNRLHR